jgi:hypothetical protein
MILSAIAISLKADPDKVNVARGEPGFEDALG